MGKLFTPEFISSGFNTTNSLNTNFSNLEVALDNVLSRTGVQPNAMLSLLDMDDHDIVNVGSLWTDDLYVDGRPVPSLKDIQDLWERLIAGPRTINTSYTLVELDRFRPLLAIGETVVTIPTDAQASDIPVGWYTYVAKMSTGRVTFSVDGLTVHAVDDSREILEENAWVALIKLAPNTWAIVGNLA
jgi:hypothetical protein